MGFCTITKSIDALVGARAWAISDCSNLSIAILTYIRVLSDRTEFVKSSSSIMEEPPTEVCTFQPFVASKQAAETLLQGVLRERTRRPPRPLEEPQLPPLPRRSGPRSWEVTTKPPGPLPRISPPVICLAAVSRDATEAEAFITSERHSYVKNAYENEMNLRERPWGTDTG